MILNLQSFILCKILARCHYIVFIIDKMASGLKLHIKISELQDEINRRSDLTESLKREHFIAARKIQVSEYKI